MTTINVAEHKNQSIFDINTHVKCPGCCSNKTPDMIKYEKYMKIHHNKIKDIPIKVNIKLLNGSTINIGATHKDTVKTLKIKIENQISMPHQQQQLIFKGLSLKNYAYLLYYNIKHGSIIKLTLTLGLRQIYYDITKHLLEIVDPFNRNRFKISSFNILPQSNYINDIKDMTGIILYKYNNKTNWYLNNIKCKSGNILLKINDNIKNEATDIGGLHGKCYYSVFNMNIDNKLIGAGFSYIAKNKKWKFNSYAMNTQSIYHNNNKLMHILEQQCITIVINNWKSKIANTHCKDFFVNKYKGCCNDDDHTGQKGHGFY